MCTRCKSQGPQRHLFENHSDADFVLKSFYTFKGLHFLDTPELLGTVVQLPFECSAYFDAQASTANSYQRDTEPLIYTSGFTAFVNLSLSRTGISNRSQVSISTSCCHSASPQAEHDYAGPQTGVHPSQPGRVGPNSTSKDSEGRLIRTFATPASPLDAHLPWEHPRATATHAAGNYPPTPPT